MTKLSQRSRINHAYRALADRRTCSRWIQLRRPRRWRRTTLNLGHPTSGWPRTLSGCLVRRLNSPIARVQGLVPVKGLVGDQPLSVNLEEGKKVGEAGISTQRQLAGDAFHLQPHDRGGLPNLNLPE